MQFMTRLLGLGALLTALVLTGCSSGGKPDNKKADDEEAHGHPSKGPHGGALAEWGDEEYHPEFTVDHEKKKATVYILDGTARKVKPIAADSITLTILNVKPPLVLTLKAEPEESDPKGSSSRFSGTDEKLGVEMDFQGEISGKVGNTPYSGKFKEKDHDHKH